SLSQAELSPEDDAVPPLLVSIVTPCLNEEKTLGAVLERAQQALTTYGYAGEIVVADNGSTDRSMEIALEAGARVVLVETRGYGSAILGGANAAHGKIVIMGDADDTYDFMEIDRLIKLIQEGGCDLVMGTRLRGTIEKDAMPALHRYLGTPVLTWLINCLFHTKISDCNCGLRAFTKEAFAKMKLHSTGMEFASEMIIKSGLLHLRIGEAPVSLRVDRRGRVPHLNTWRDGWRHLRFILTYAADRLLLVPGVFMVLVGIVGFVMLMRGPIMVGGLFMDFHFLFPSSLSVVIGMQLVLFTFITRIYTGLSRYSEGSGSMQQWFNVETAMILGVLLLLMGLGINLALVVIWLHHYGDGLFAVRPAILALTLMAVGTQLFFNSFLIGVLTIPQNISIPDNQTQR
ncbi:MAG TPA: glycosyltransferase family 2 protein, partial [Trichormus sp.]